MYPFLPTVFLSAFSSCLGISLLTQFSFGSSISLSTFSVLVCPSKCPNRISGILPGIQTLGSQIFPEQSAEVVLPSIADVQTNVSLILFESYLFTPA